MKLTESQAESMALMHASICNGLLYAEDLSKDKVFKQALHPFVIKFQWMKTTLELRLPYEKRKASKEIDTLKYDELARLMSGMNEDQICKLEEFAKTLIQ
jgi:hypothetical protein